MIAQLGERAPEAFRSIQRKVAGSSPARGIILFVLRGRGGATVGLHPFAAQACFVPPYHKGKMGLRGRSFFREEHLARCRKIENEVSAKPTLTLRVHILVAIRNSFPPRTRPTAAPASTKASESRIARRQGAPFPTTASTAYRDQIETRAFCAYRRLIRLAAGLLMARETRSLLGTLSKDDFQETGQRTSSQRTLQALIL